MFFVVKGFDFLGFCQVLKPTRQREQVEKNTRSQLDLLFCSPPGVLSVCLSFQKTGRC